MWIFNVVQATFKTFFLVTNWLAILFHQFHLHWKYVPLNCKILKFKRLWCIECFQLHRRLLYDDSKGVSEPLDEVQFNKGLVARGVHIVQLSKAAREVRQASNSSANTTTPAESAYKFQDGAARHRLEALKLVYGPLFTFTPTTLTAAEWSKRFRMKVTFVNLKIFQKTSVWNDFLFTFYL